MSVMFKTIFHGVGAMCSALAAVSGMILVIDLIILQILSEQIREAKGGDANVKASIDQFGSFSQTLLTLWKSVFDEWRDFYDTLEAVSLPLAIIFLICILVMVIGPLNIITGIFVEQA